MSLLIMLRSWQYTVRGIVYTVPGIVYTNPPNHYSFINPDFPWENSKATPSFERVEGFLVKYIPRKNKGYRLDCVVSDNLTCEIIHDNAFQLSLVCKSYCLSKTVLYIINRKIHGCLEIPDLFLVHDQQCFIRYKIGGEAEYL